MVLAPPLQFTEQDIGMFICYMERYEFFLTLSLVCLCICGLHGSCYSRPIGMASLCNRTDSNLHFHHLYLFDLL
jgi:hypothetical protein